MKPYLSIFFQLKSLQIELARWGCFTSCQLRSDPLTAEGTVSSVPLRVQRTDANMNPANGQVSILFWQTPPWDQMHSGVAKLSRDCGKCHRGVQRTSQHQIGCMSSWPGFCGAPSLGWEVARTDLTPIQGVCDAVTLCHMHYIHVSGRHAPGAK